MGLVLQSAHVCNKMCGMCTLLAIYVCERLMLQMHIAHFDLSSKKTAATDHLAGIY